MTSSVCRLWCVGLIAVLGARGALAASQAGPVLSADGRLIKAVEGRLVQSGGRWLLELEAGIRQGPLVLEKGKTLEILPSATLEALAGAATQRPADRVRLTGLIQTYHGRNYLFVLSSVPLSGTATDANSVPLPASDRDPNREPAPLAAAKGDPLAIPESIQKKLAAYQANRRLAPPTATPIPAAPQALLDQVGRILQDQGKTFFLADGLGQNAVSSVFELLPSGTLESMEHLQSQTPEPVRFRVAGLATQYRQHRYLLIQRASREHSYGNFGR
jgi:hypothetical protein